MSLFHTQKEKTAKCHWNQTVFEEGTRLGKSQKTVRKSPKENNFIRLYHQIARDQQAIAYTSSSRDIEEQNGQGYKGEDSILSPYKLPEEYH